MLYAIVDIETTGGYAAANGITEVAVFISDGQRVVDTYQALLNPMQLIPPYVEALTGITNEMVQNERPFGHIAAELFELLQDKVFVAHNVNFDYSFVKFHLGEAGFQLNSKKLCTIRLSRQIIPGLPGYGLGKLCKYLGIPIENRHRAGGDAAATAVLFHHLVQKDTRGVLDSMLKVKSKQHFLPPNLDPSMINRLPNQPGVYYFHDKKGKIIYVGKAKNLSKRVNSHFSNNKPGRQKQEFLRKIYSITFQPTATELMAFILESIEIKKIWPEQNRSLKRFEQTYGLYAFEDQKGFIRLGIEKKKKNLPPLYTFGLLMEGQGLLRKLIPKFGLCPKRCYLQSEQVGCQGEGQFSCDGICERVESPESYNRRVQDCINHLQKELPSFAILDQGLEEAQQSCILMERGRFYGMGYLPSDSAVHTMDDLKDYLTPYLENDYIRGLVYSHAAKYPYKKISLGS